MFLVNWTTANILVGATMLTLILIPVIIGVIVFTKKSKNKPGSSAEG